MLEPNTPPRSRGSCGERRPEGVGGNIGEGGVAPPPPPPRRLWCEDEGDVVEELSSENLLLAPESDAFLDEVLVLVQSLGLLPNRRGLLPEETWEESEDLDEDADLLFEDPESELLSPLSG